MAPGFCLMEVQQILDEVVSPGALPNIHRLSVLDRSCDISVHTRAALASPQMVVAPSPVDQGSLLPPSSRRDPGIRRPQHLCSTSSRNYPHSIQIFPSSSQRYQTQVCPNLAGVRSKPSTIWPPRKFLSKNDNFVSSSSWVLVVPVRAATPAAPAMGAAPVKAVG
jgi:hypothetical protein